MAIQIANNCSNCSALSSDSVCSIHEVTVSGLYTCNQFNAKSGLKGLRECGNCSRHQSDNCAHPQKAAPGMSCASWAPKAEVLH